MTTHESSFSPPRSLVMVGRAVDTMVWSSAASSIVSMRAPSAQCRWRVPDSSYVGHTAGRRRFDGVTALHALGEATGEASERGKVPLGPVLESVAEHRQSLPTGLVDELLPLGGHLQLCRPAVVRIRCAHQQSIGLQGAEVSAHGGGVEACVLGEVGRTQRTHRRQVRQQGDDRLVLGRACGLSTNGEHDRAECVGELNQVVGRFGRVASPTTHFSCLHHATIP